MKLPVTIEPKNGTAYTVRSSQGVYLAFSNYYQAVCAVSDLIESYKIDIDLNPSAELAMRLLQTENVYRQLYYAYNGIPEELMYLPPITLPYFGIGTSLPKININNSCYVIICSDGRYFCLQTILEVSQLLVNLMPVEHIAIRKYSDAIAASRAIIARDAANRVMAGESLELLPPVQAGINYAKQGQTGNFTNNFLLK